jgi:integral membrane sensor domain MASE1
MTNKTNKIEWKKLLWKAMEDGIKKAVEVAFIAILVGASIKLVMAAIPGVMVGAVIAKMIKIWGLSN